MSENTRKLLLGCIPVIKHMSEIKKETILQFDVNSNFMAWYNVSYGDLKATKTEEHMKNVTTPETLAGFETRKHNAIREMTLPDMKHVHKMYGRLLFEDDIEEYDMNPTASTWMFHIFSTLDHNIDMSNNTDLVGLARWINQHYIGIFQYNNLGELVPVPQQPTNTEYYSFDGWGGRMVCMRCSKRLDH
jgi:hypothetical protein